MAYLVEVWLSERFCYGKLLNICQRRPTISWILELPDNCTQKEKN